MERETIPAIAQELAPEPTIQAPKVSPLSSSMDTALQGAVLVLIQFDICEEIRLDELRRIFGVRTVQAPSFKHPTPGYVRYERPPVVETIEPLVLESGERLDAQVKYYDYGVLSVVFELPFSGDWDTLVRLSSRWVWDTDFTSFATKIARQKLERAAPALVKPYEEWLHEDYFIFHVRDVAGNPSAADLLALEGQRIAQVVRGETALLSEGERQEICNPASPTIPTISPSSAGTAPSFMTAHPAPRPPSSSLNTPIRSCSNSATTTTC